LAGLLATPPKLFMIPLYQNIIYQFPLNLCLPISSSKNNRKSEIRDQSGYLKVAGLFFSIKAWLIHAKPYPKMGTYHRNLSFPELITYPITMNTNRVPMK